ncbi:MAG TPA: phosphotransferase family protein, partial [Saprospiraceae bacterium]|nr:phosphotransferase family protein [Saprospiraceae bacterium]
MIDQPKEVRKENELDRKVLYEYLKVHIPNLMGDLTVQQYSGGASNITYLLTFGNLELILRCPPKGTISKGAHDMQREYNIMKALIDFYPY